MVGRWCYLEDDGLGRDDEGGDVYGSYGITAMIHDRKGKVGCASAFHFAFMEKKNKEKKNTLHTLAWHQSISISISCI